MSNIKQNVLITFTVDERTASRIDRFRHARRIDSRSDALRILVKKGLLDLEDHSTDNPPTQKQIDLVNELCAKKGLEPPEVWSSKAFGSFIAKQIKTKKDNKKEDE